MADHELAGLDQRQDAFIRRRYKRLRIVADGELRCAITKVHEAQEVEVNVEALHPQGRQDLGEQVRS